MAFAFLKRWLGGRPRQRPDLRFLLYTRAHCPLCDVAWEILTRYRQRYGFALETKDVDHAEELARLYGDCVPVVEVNGKIRFRGHVNEVLLRRILDAPPESREPEA
jgi:glutaredoxin